MSEKVCAAVWKLRLPPSEKMVLLRMAQHADDIGGGIDLPATAIAEDCCVSERAARYAIRKLTDAGLLIVAETGGGRGKRTVYVIDLKTVQILQGNGGGENSANSANLAKSAQFKAENAPINCANSANPAQFISPPIEDNILYLNEAKRSEARAQPDDGQAIASPASPEAVQVIEAFDAERTAAYGAEQSRPWPAGTDRVFAQRWLDAGASVVLCRDVFAGAMRRYAANGRKPPDSLNFFDRAIADAIATRDAPMPEGKPYVRISKQSDRQPAEQRTNGSDGITARRGIVRGLGLKRGLETVPTTAG